MEQYNNNLSVYIEDVKAYTRILETDYYDVISECKRDKTNRFDIEHGEYCSRYITLNEFNEFKDTWYSTKSHSYLLLEQICDNLKICGNYIMHTNHDDNLMVSEKVISIIDSIENIISITVAFYEDDDADTSSIYKDMFLSLTNLSIIKLKRLLFITNVLAWFADDSHMELYHEIVEPNNEDKFANYWNTIMATSPHTLGRQFSDYWKCSHCQGYAYYYHHNIINDTWYISMTRDFRNAITIKTNYYDPITVINGYIIIERNGEYFVGIKSLDIDNKDKWFVKYPKIIKSFAISERLNGISYIVSLHSEEFHQPVNKVNGEDILITEIKDTYTYGDYNYIVITDHENNLYISEETAPESFINIDKLPITNKEAHLLYTNARSV